jgi:hypothetical protein
MNKQRKILLFELEEHFAVEGVNEFTETSLRTGFSTGSESSESSKTMEKFLLQELHVHFPLIYRRRTKLIANNIISSIF